MLRAERRVCSVLFADLVGFTPLSESRDPESVRELLSAYFETARTVIARYGGVVEKFIGDAVMAVWGTPVAKEGDAERAVRAALDLVVAVTQLGAEVGASDLALRAGVVTDEVAVTLGAVGEGMVAGDAVNTAARVQTAAGAGQVWTDEATHRLAGSAISFDATGTHALKGKTEPVTLFRAVRVVAGTGGSQRVDGLEAPLLGRDAELRTVKELFHATAERRSPRLVLVSGPAGGGKSRLGWEFFKYIDGLSEQVWWHRGRCLSYGEGVTYWALAEAVRARFGIAEEDPVEAAAGKLTGLLPEFVPDPTERAYVEPRLARLLGIPLPTDTLSGEPVSREELFAGWRLFFERLADQSPVVLMVEDAQHADTALLDFVDHLVDWARTAPVFVLVLARQSLIEERPGWGTGRNRTSLTLDLLDDRSMIELVDALVPGMPAQAAAAITAQAQGNPLFAIETVRTLIDRDAVIPVDGVYRLVGEVSDLSVPDSLHGLLAARLDALDAELRALVADAAVLGTSFPAEALVAVSGRTAAEVQIALAELVRRDVLTISADPLSPQRGSYLFGQHMLRQVAYDTQSRRDRKARHLVVAAHLQTVFALEEIAEVIARHYLDALDAVPEDPDVPALRADATRALLRAADSAENGGAPARAAHGCATAAELTAADGTPTAAVAAAQLWERAADLANTAGEFDEAYRHAAAARERYTAAGRDRDAARACVQVALNARWSGRSAEARELLVPALEVLRPDPDADTVLALLELATLQINDEAGGSGEALIDEALALGQAVPVPDRQLAQLFNRSGVAFSTVNKFGQAIAAFDYGIKLADRAGDSRSGAGLNMNLANTLLGLDATAAGHAARNSYETARRIGARNVMAMALGNLVIAALFTGEWDTAAALLVRARDEDGLEHAYADVAAGTLAALRGDLEAARLYGALPDLRASDDAQDRATGLIIDALVADAEHRPADALELAHQVIALENALSLASEFLLLSWPLAARAAIEIDDLDTLDDLLARLDAHPPGHIPPLLRAERTMARACLLARHEDPHAATALADAVTQLRAASSPYHLAHGLLDHAAHLTDPADRDRLVTEAAAIADRLGAAPLARRAADLGTQTTAHPGHDAYR